VTTVIVTVLAIPIPKWHFFTEKFVDIVTILAEIVRKIRLKAFE